MISLPKIPKISDLVDALVELDQRVEANSARLDVVEAGQAARIEVLEHQIADHQAGAVHRQRDLDKLQAEAFRTRRLFKYGRR